LQKAVQYFVREAAVRGRKRDDPVTIGCLKGCERVENLFEIPFTRNLHQIYDTLIYQARQMFRGIFSEKNFGEKVKNRDAGNYAVYPAILRLKKCNPGFF
jgi:hypothetical protein